MSGGREQPWTLAEAAALLRSGQSRVLALRATHGTATKWQRDPRYMDLSFSWLPPLVANAKTQVHISRREQAQPSGYCGGSKDDIGSRHEVHFRPGLRPGYPGSWCSGNPHDGLTVVNREGRVAP